MAILGKIDPAGVLYLARGGKLIEQICPYGAQKNCSHHCPLFGEPFWDSEREKIGLSLCGRIVIVFDAFRDERENFSEKKD